MDKENLSYKTLKNSSYLFIGFLLPMVFTIFVTREMTKMLGTLEFGVFLLINAINSFIGYLDLGLTTSVTKYASEYHAQENKQSLQDLLGSSKVLFLFVGIFGLIVFIILGKWFLPIFNLPSQSFSSIFIVFLLAGFVFLFNSLNATYNAVLAALQRYDLITKVGTINLILVSIGTIILLEYGFQLKAVMALNVISSFLQLLVFKFYSNKLLPNIEIKFLVVKDEIKKAYRFGVQTFISSLSDSILVFLDRLIIPIFLGPAQLAYYSVPGNIALKISGVTNNLTGMFFPMASALAGTGQMEKLKSIYIRAFRNLSVIAFALSLSVILFAEKILYFWLGQDYANNGKDILKILGVVYYIIALYIPLRSLLLGLGQVKLLIRQSLIMAVINVVLLLILVPKFGIMGAAWAYFISILPMIVTFYWVEKKLFNITDQGKYYLKLYSKLVIAGVFSTLIVYFGILPFVINVWYLVVLGPISVLVYIFIYYIFGFIENEDKRLFQDYLISVKERLFG